MGVHPPRLVDLGGVDLEPAVRCVSAHESGASHIGDLVDRLALGQPVRHLHQRALGVAVQQDVALAVEHHGAAHGFGPVVVMGDAAQAAFDTTQHNGHLFVGLAAALAVDGGRAVGPFAAHITRGVGVVGADLAIGRVAVDHGIHVARCHTPEQVGLAQHLERFGTVPVGLGDDAHAETLCLQHTAHHRHAKAGVVHIGIARDENDVAAVPAQTIHFGPAHRQERRGAKAPGPVRSVAGQRFGSARKKGDVDEGVHGQMDSPFIIQAKDRPHPPRDHPALTVPAQCVKAHP